MNELIGKYLNGYKIVKVEKDPFIKGQINLWTDEWGDIGFGDKSLTKFVVRDENNTAKVYQKLIDKEKYDLQQRIDKAIEHIEKHQFIFISQYEERSNFVNHLLEILKGANE